VHFNELTVWWDRIAGRVRLHRDSVGMERQATILVMALPDIRFAYTRDEVSFLVPHVTASVARVLVRPPWGLLDRDGRII
jgi:hypothetical protein